MKPSEKIASKSAQPAGAGGVSGLGFRMTEQRRAVLDTLIEQRDHPTAVEVFMRVKQRVPSISLGTVYNCLETLEQSGLIRTVTHDRDSARFCPNLSEHAHLFCRKCGSVTDIPLRATHADHGVTWEVPERVQIETQVVAFHGLCAECSGQTQVQLHGATTSVSHELEPKHEGS